MLSFLSEQIRTKDRENRPLCWSKIAHTFTRGGMFATFWCPFCCRGLEYDFIEGRRYEFTVTAVDGGETPLTGTASVRVWMKNVNDRAPVFEPETQWVRSQATCSKFVSFPQSQF